MVKEKSPLIRALVLITTEKSANIATEMFKAGGVHVKYGILAEGTASSEILDMLGLGSTEKRMLLTVLPKKLADIMLKKLHDELSLSKADGGIGFTIPITGVSGLLMHLMSEQNISEDAVEDERRNRETNMNEERKYTLISAVINRGFGGDVMTAAREAGAKGGTIVHSRQIIDEESTGFWGISMQEEKEILLILTEAEQKLAIMKAISEKFGLHSEAKGIVTSMPIDTVMGF